MKCPKCNSEEITNKCLNSKYPEPEIYACENCGYEDYKNKFKGENK